MGPGWARGNSPGGGGPRPIGDVDSPVARQGDWPFGPCRSTTSGERSSKLQNKVPASLAFSYHHLGKSMTGGTNRFLRQQHRGTVFFLWAMSAHPGDDGFDVPCSQTTGQFEFSPNPSHSISGSTSSWRLGAGWNHWGGRFRLRRLADRPPGWEALARG